MRKTGIRGAADSGRVRVRKTIAAQGGHRSLQLGRVVADAHGATAEHVGRTDEERVADPVCGLERLGDVGRDRPRWAADTELLGEQAEALPVLREVDRLVRRAEDAVAALL